MAETAHVTLDGVDEAAVEQIDLMLQAAGWLLPRAIIRKWNQTQRERAQVFADAEQLGYEVKVPGFIRRALKKLDGNARPLAGGGRIRQGVMGFDSLEPLAPRERRMVEIMTQAGFQPRRLVLPGNDANSFVIHQVLVGTSEQLAINGGGYRGDLFSAEALTDVPFDTAPIGGSIRLDVQNISDEPRRFRAAMMGLVSDDDGVRFEEPFIAGRLPDVLDPFHRALASPLTITTQAAPTLFNPAGAITIDPPQSQTSGPVRFRANMIGDVLR